MRGRERQRAFKPHRGYRADIRKSNACFNQRQLIDPCCNGIDGIDANKGQFGPVDSDQSEDKLLCSCPFEQHFELC